MNNLNYLGESFLGTDRGLGYGDGFFSTMLVEGGYIKLLPLHVERMLQDGSQLGLHLNASSLTTLLQKIATSAPRPVCKVIITSGVGGRGYQRPADTLCNVHTSFHDYPTHYKHWQSEGISVGVSPVKLAIQPLLAGAKHLNRLEQVLIKSAMSHINQQDVLVCDQSGVLIEASAANVFWLDQYCWKTPKLNNCGVHGVMRRFIMKYFERVGIRVEEVSVEVTALKNAKSAFLCNSLMQIVPIKSLCFDSNTLMLDTLIPKQLWMEMKQDYV